MKKKRSKPSNIITVLFISALLIGASLFFRNLYFNSKTVPLELPASSKLLEEAQKNLTNYDYIVNLDTMRIVWVRPATIKLVGYTVDEALKLKNVDLLDETYDLGLAYSQIINRMVDKEGVFETVIEKKDGSNLKINVIYKTFTLDKRGYIVGRLNRYETVSDEEAAKYYSE